MKKVFRSAAALSLAAVLALSFTGCGHNSNSFTWRVSQTPDNLDPQLAATSINRMAVTHLYSGLFRMGPDGQLNNECAESYTVSPDGLTYTFIIKEDLFYQTTKGKPTEYAVTAEDFVFGLQRVFLPETGSPYASELGNIAGSDAVLQGGDPDQLGVHALDSHTLEIRLTSPDDEFLKKLCLPGAMPCDEEFFTSTGGAYGLTRKDTISNGSFYLYSWTDSGLFLRRDPGSHLVDNLRLVLPSEDDPKSGDDEAESQTMPPEEQVAEGSCDAAIAAGTSFDTEEALTQLPFTSTTWALVYNTQGVFASQALRAALTQIAWNTDLALPEGCTRADSMLPPAMGLGSCGLPGLGDPHGLYQQGLAEAGKTTLTGLTVLVPEGAEQLIAPLNQEWQKQLQAFFSVKELPLPLLQGWVSGSMAPGDIERLERQHGRWAVALLPISPVSMDPVSMLDQFDDKLGSWQNDEYHRGLQALASMPSGDTRRNAALRLEKNLLQQVPAAPLFFQSHALLVNPEIEGIVFEPFGPLLDLTYATRK